MKTTTIIALVSSREDRKVLYEFSFDTTECYLSQNFIVYLAVREFEEKQKYQPNLRKLQNWYIEAIIDD